MAEIAVIGAGHVGLTTAACLSRLGHDVVCTDASNTRISQLVSGRLPIVEPELDQLVQEGLSSGRLRFGSDNVDAARGADYLFICVPTTLGPDGHAELSDVEAVICEVGPELKAGAIVVAKSTMPLGSTKIIQLIMGRTDVALVSNPEFLREGRAVHDFLYPDRLVIGAEDNSVGLRVASLYHALNAPLVLTDLANAEVIKYVSNAFLATKLSFANATAALCEAVGADVEQVLYGMGLDGRIGLDFLRPGPGWGGSCLPKDAAALVCMAADAGYDFSLLKAVIAANEQQCRWVLEKIVKVVGGSLTGSSVALLGLTFKAGTDDLRDSPALAIASKLCDGGAKVTAYDPTVDVSNPPECCISLRLALAGGVYDAADGADVLVIGTDWPELRSLCPSTIARIVRKRVVVDTRNCLDAGAWRQAGFIYQGLGRK